MIYTRTANDVKEAIRLREEKVQKGVGLTEKEADTLERGMLTINTLNRIEGKQKELVQIFNSMGYWNVAIVNKTWKQRKEDIFTEADFQRIVNNCEMLKEAFYIFSDTPKKPKAEYSYKTFNALEKILFDLEKMTEDIKKYYRKSGTFQSGEENIQ